MRRLHNSFDTQMPMLNSCHRRDNYFKIERKSKVHIKFRAVAISMILATVPSLAVAQSAPAGTCQFFSDPNYGGQGGQYPSGQGSYLMQQSDVPEALAKSNTLSSYKMFNSPELAGFLSSVKVGAGCMAGWARPVDGQYRFKETRQDVPNFTDTNDQAVAVYCSCK